MERAIAIAVSPFLLLSIDFTRSSRVRIFLFLVEDAAITLDILQHMRVEIKSAGQTRAVRCKRAADWSSC